MKKLTYVVLQLARVVPPLRQEKSPALRQSLSSHRLPLPHHFLVQFQELSLESSDWPFQMERGLACRLPASLQIPLESCSYRAGPSASKEHLQ